MDPSQQVRHTKEGHKRRNVKGYHFKNIPLNRNWDGIHIITIYILFDEQI